MKPEACTIKNYVSVIKGLYGKLVFWPVQASVFFQARIHWLRAKFAISSYIMDSLCFIVHALRPIL
jgi:hypothetical protein